MIDEGLSSNDFITKSEALFISKRWTVALFKQFLISLENLKKEHDINFEKLHKAFPNNKDLIDMADYFDEKRAAIARKTVLDIGNEVARNLERDINNL
jgi:hypothetical protein